MATPVTKATLVTEVAELKAQLEAAQASAQPVEVQPAKLTSLEKRIQNANNSTVVLVNNCQPITRQDGSVIAGGVSIPGQQTLQVNLGTMAEPTWQRVEVQTTWFEAWTNGTDAEPHQVAYKLTALCPSTSWALIRVY